MRASRSGWGAVGGGVVAIAVCACGGSTSLGTAGNAHAAGGSGGVSSGGFGDAGHGTGGAGGWFGSGGASVGTGGAGFVPGCTTAPACGSCMVCYDLCYCTTSDTQLCVSACSNGGGGAGSGGSEAGGAANDGGACVDCMPIYDLHWGQNGGWAMFTDTSRLGPCRSYEHERTTSGSQTPTLLCTADLPTCPDRTLSDIISLLRDPVVQTALGNHSLFGTDPRPVDGTVFRFGVGNDYVDVGGPCNGSPSCVAIPPQIAEFAALLQSLDSAELATEPCKSTFAP